MKKYITVSILLMAIVIVLIKSGVVHSLLLFFLVGAVPGTSITISPAIMLIMTIAAIAITGSKLFGHTDSRSN